ncbi:MAG: hypothetical protein GY754_36975 [bacterium]|nr:hypothetical protein [bacterium]
MKRILLVIGIILFLAVNFSCKCKKEAPKDEKFLRTGIVNFFSGDVKLESKGKTTEATVGAVISQDMKIITAKDSFVDIYLGEDVLKVLAESVVEMKQLVTNLKDNSQETNVFINKGKVFTKISRKLAKGDAFQISSPTTVAGVRGTDFSVEEKDGKAKVACLDGKIRVRDADKPDSEAVELNAGQECDITKGEALNVRDLSELNKKNLQRIKSEIKEIQQDIRKQFEEEREQIRKQVVEQKEKNKTMVEEQKAVDKENVEKIKSDNKELMDAAKADTAATKDEAKEAVGKIREDLEKAAMPDRDEEENIKPDMDVKPDIKKFKPDVNVPKIGE